MADFVDVDPQVVGERLAELMQLSKGPLLPREIVEEARRPESPLHPCFEWDIEKAAARFHVAQACALMENITTEAGSSMFISVDLP